MSSAVRILAFPKEAAFDILLTFTNSVIGYTMCVFKFFHDSIHIHIGCTYLIFLIGQLLSFDILIFWIDRNIIFNIDSNVIF